MNNYTHTFSASHASADYTFHNEPIEARADMCAKYGGRGFYAVHLKLGCSKTKATPEQAIRELVASANCTNISIAEWREDSQEHTKEARREHGEAIARRQAANTPWPAPAPKIEETGKRTMLRACIPDMGLPGGFAELALAEAFGGFTRYAMEGIWIETNGAIKSETGYVWEVSFEPSARREALARELLVNIAEAQDQIWVHIERHEFEALHTKVAR